MFIHTLFREILITLGFMTRLAPVIDIEAKDLEKTIRWMPLIGFIMGVIIVLPFYLGLFNEKPWIQAWLTVCLSMYLTRGLHFDGIADITDGAGPYPNPERFWKILKDSRSGVFGILALTAVVSGQIIGFYYIYEAHLLKSVIWVFIVGRLANGLMSKIGKPFAKQGQGILFMNGADNFSISMASIITVLLGFLLVPFKVQIATYVLLALCLFFLYSLAKKMKGANGDFLGAALVLAEISALLAINCW